MSRNAWENERREKPASWNTGSGGADQQYSTGSTADFRGRTRPPTPPLIAGVQDLSPRMSSPRLDPGGGQISTQRPLIRPPPVNVAFANSGVEMQQHDTMRVPMAYSYPPPLAPPMQHSVWNSIDSSHMGSSHLHITGVSIMEDPVSPGSVEDPGGSSVVIDGAAMIRAATNHSGMGSIPYEGDVANPHFGTRGSAAPMLYAPPYNSYSNSQNSSTGYGYNSNIGSSPIVAQYSGITNGNYMPTRTTPSPNSRYTLHRKEAASVHSANIISSSSFVGNAGTLKTRTPSPSDVRSLSNVFTRNDYSTNSSNQSDTPVNSNMNNYSSSIDSGSIPTGLTVNSGNGNFSAVGLPSQTSKAGGSGPGTPRGYYRKNNSRIDPSQMPRPDRPHLCQPFYTRSGSSGGRKNPPSVNAVYTSIDTGNAIPKHMRMTTVAPPTSKDAMKKAGVPVGVLATPFAPMGSESRNIGFSNRYHRPFEDEDKSNGDAEEEVPVVDLCGENPVRCNRCHAYINPSVGWPLGSNGEKWLCNFCGYSNTTPSWYYCSLNGSGERFDAQSRPELQLGTVDFVVNADYCTRKPQESIYVFAIDVSEKAIHSGTTIAALRAVQTCIKRLHELELDSQTIEEELENTSRVVTQHIKTSPKSGVKNSSSFLLDLLSQVGTGIANVALQSDQSSAKVVKDSIVEKAFGASSRITKVGIVTFDKNVHYYAVELGNNNPEPLKLYVCDSNDPVAPLPPSEWLHSIADSEGTASLLFQLKRIPELVASMQGLDQHGFAQRSRNNSQSSLPEYYFNQSQYNMHSSTNTTAENLCCPAAAIKAVQDGLGSLGGKLYLVTSSHSTVGYGRIPKFRETVGVYGGPKEFSLYGSPEHILGASESPTSPGKPLTDEETLLYNQYIDLATSCRSSQLCVSVFACVGDLRSSSAAFDSSLLAEPVTKTGGNLVLLTGSMCLEENVYRLEQQLMGDLAQEVGAEGVVKLRTSGGWRVDEYYGPGHYSSVDEEVELVGLNTSTSFAFTLRNESNSKEDEIVHLQLAVLYTSTSWSFHKNTDQSNGNVLHANTNRRRQQRMIRVHNMSLLSSSKPTVIFRNSDIEAVTALLFKQALYRALTYPQLTDVKETSHLAARTFLDKSLCEILISYRRYCSAQSPRGQLILPDALKVLPLLTLAMLKHTALLENGSISRQPSGIIASGSSSNLSNYVSNQYYGNAYGRITVRGAERAFELRRQLSLPIKEVINSLYPRMYCILSLFEDALEDTDYPVDDSGSVVHDYQEEDLLPMYMANPAALLIEFNNYNSLMSVTHSHSDSMNDFFVARHRRNSSFGSDGAKLFGSSFTDSYGLPLSPQREAIPNAKDFSQEHSVYSPPIKEKIRCDQLTAPIFYAPPPSTPPPSGLSPVGKVPLSSSASPNLTDSGEKWIASALGTSLHHQLRRKELQETSILKENFSGETSKSSYPGLNSKTGEEIARRGLLPPLYDRDSTTNSNSVLRGSADFVKLEENLHVLAANSSAESLHVNRISPPNDMRLNSDKNLTPAKEAQWKIKTLFARQETARRAISVNRKNEMRSLNTLIPSAEAFESDQLYLLDDRSTLWLFVGRAVPQTLVEEIFEFGGNVSASTFGRPEHVTFRVASSLGRKIASFVEYLRNTSNCKQELVVIWADANMNHPLMTRFSARLVEDSMPGMMSYVDYLCNMHSKIQSKL